MERYPRLFVQASLVYLAIGSVMGVLISAGALSPFAWRFVHLHLNLLGFVTLIVSGVAYHIIPRFTGRPVKHPRLIGVHFWLANIGLLGMIGTRGSFGAAGDETTLSFSSFFAAVAASGACLFVWNLFPLLIPSRVKASSGRVSPQMKVSEVLERWPSSLATFKAYGFAALANPAARATFAKLVTIEKACRIHKVDVEVFTKALEAATEGRESSLSILDEESPPRTTAGGTGPRAFGLGTTVGELVRQYPATRGILERHFGPDCFSCPGQVQETLEQAAAMHGVDPGALLEELRSVIGIAADDKPGGQPR
jgi:hybrid cluster-associated redox disulfide protein